jgi:hypothetical protein
MLSVNDEDYLPDMLDAVQQAYYDETGFWNLILTSQRMIHHRRWIMVSQNLIHQNSQMMILMQ